MSRVGEQFDSSAQYQIEYARVAQLAEAVGLDPIQCEFESHPGYQHTPQCVTIMEQQINA